MQLAKTTNKNLIVAFSYAIFASIWYSAYRYLQYPLSLYCFISFFRFHSAGWYLAWYFFYFFEIDPWWNHIITAAVSIGVNTLLLFLVLELFAWQRTTIAFAIDRYVCVAVKKYLWPTRWLQENKLYKRYKRLSLWNKIEFWGALASLLGVALVVFQYPDPLQLFHSTPLKVSYDVTTYPDYVYLNVLPNHGLDWIQAYCISVPIDLFVDMNLRASMQTSQIDIAPFLLIDLIDVQPMPREVIGEWRSERGDSGTIRDFLAVLIPKPGLYGAPHVMFEPGEFTFPPYDYYRLGAGEAEEFTLHFEYLPDYVYTFRIGILYRIDGQRKTLWINETFCLGRPSRKIPIYWFPNTDSFSFSIGLMGDPIDVEIVKNEHVIISNFMKRQRLFSLPQLRTK